MNMLQLNLWISELADLTGVSTRTIRYYIEEGLLPQPEIRGKYAVFNDDYLVRLKLIKYLKDAYLPLKEIRKRLDTLMIPEMRDLLTKFEQDPVRALAELEVYSTDKPDAAELPSPLMDSAQDYISQVMQKRPIRLNKEERSSFTTPAAPAAVKYNFSQESWQRVELAPGIELNIRQPQPTARRSQINELIELARKIFTGRQ
jgi:DNA-binding transcriptional MerR regulator